MVSEVEVVSAKASERGTISLFPHLLIEYRGTLQDGNYDIVLTMDGFHGDEKMGILSDILKGLYENF